MAQLREWSDTLVRSLEPIPDPRLLEPIAEASRNMRGLVTEIIAWKRADPADDLLSALINAEDDGEVLSSEELEEQVALLYIAGHETTVNLIGNGTLALLRHPEQLDRLREDPSLAAAAVEELLRYDSPVQMTRRITLAPMEIAGKSIEAGSFLVLALGSANRDPARWGPTADRLDIGRQGTAQHVSFGGGHHNCLGAHLARLEARVAIGALARRYERLELAGVPVWNGRINLRGLSHLPLRGLRAP